MFLIVFTSGWKFQSYILSFSCAPHKREELTGISPYPLDMGLHCAQVALKIWVHMNNLIMCVCVCVCVCVMCDVYAVIHQTEQFCCAFISWAATHLL